MFYKLMGFPLFCVLIATVSACSTNPPQATVFPVSVTEWEYKLPKQANTWKITYVLPERAIAEFSLFDGKAKKGYDIARIGLSNQNCTNGHQMSISHKQTALESYVNYLNKEIPWNKPNTISLTQVGRDILVVEVNGEKIEATLVKPVSTLKIKSYLAPIEIYNIESITQ